jgi:hypothetical protein
VMFRIVLLITAAGWCCPVVYIASCRLLQALQIPDDSFDYHIDFLYINRA